MLGSYHVLQAYLTVQQRKEIWDTFSVYLYVETFVCWVLYLKIMSKDEWTGLACLEAVFWHSRGQNEKNNWIQQNSYFLLRFKLDNFWIWSRSV